MADKGLKELYIDELKDLYSAENQLVKALPKMAKAATSPGFESRFRGAPGTDERSCAALRDYLRAARRKSEG